MPPQRRKPCGASHFKSLPPGGKVAAQRPDEGPGGKRPANGAFWGKCRRGPGRLARRPGPRRYRVGHKPGSVSNGDLSWPRVAARLTPSPGQSARLRRAQKRPVSHTDVASGRVYIAAKSPLRWWALTPPFHPCSALTGRGGLFLLHWPWGRPRLPLAAALPLKSPDFPQVALPPSRRRPARSVRLLYHFLPPFASAAGLCYNTFAALLRKAQKPALRVFAARAPCSVFGHGAKMPLQANIFACGIIPSRLCCAKPKSPLCGLSVSKKPAESIFPAAA